MNFSSMFYPCLSNYFFIGDPSEEGELLTWLLYQMKEDTIENINRELLFTMIADTEFLSVFFCKMALSLWIQNLMDCV